MTNVASFPGITTAYGNTLVAAGNTLYFQVRFGSQDGGLYASDGSTAGTRQVQTKSGGPLTAFGNKVVYSFDDGVHGLEPWISDGTAAGTVPLGDLEPGNAASYPEDFTVLGSKIYFEANTSSRLQIWVTDGTAAGTVLFNGVADPFYEFGNLIAAGSTIFFSTQSNSSTSVYAIDSASNETQVATIPGATGVARLSQINGRVYFTVTTAEGNSLDETDGTAAGTVDLGLIGPPNLLRPLDPIMMAPDGNLVIFGDDGIHGGEPLLVTDPPILRTVADMTTTPGSAIQFSAIASKPGAAIGFRLGADAPPGASIDPVTGVFSWIAPQVGLTTTYSITILATDLANPALVASQTFHIFDQGVNQPPTIAAIPDLTIVLGATATFTAQATDPDAGQSLTFRLDAGAPDGASIDPTTGVFTWTPTSSQGFGVFPITVRVTDNGSPALSASTTVAIAVRGSANLSRPVVGDYDGDGKTDLSIYNTDYGVLAYRPSSGGADHIQTFGPPHAGFVAVSGDYDGDGKTDFAIYNTQYAVFAYRPSSGGPDVIQTFGPANAGFVPIAGDYDGDGKTDLAIYNTQYGVLAYRPSSGGPDVIQTFGPANAGFVAITGDYDGDGKTDFAIYNTQYGVLAYRPSSVGPDVIQTFGPANAGFVALAGDYDGDGKTDFAIYNEQYGVLAYRPSSGGGDVIQTFGPPNAGFVAITGDYDGDGKTDFAIYNTQYGVFAYRPSSGGPDVIPSFGPANSGFVATLQPVVSTAVVGATTQSRTLAVTASVPVGPKGSSFALARTQSLASRSKDSTVFPARILIRHHKRLTLQAKLTPRHNRA